MFRGFADGNDVEAIDAAVEEAKKDPRPSIILLPHNYRLWSADQSQYLWIHGSPAGKDELAKAKENVGCG
jgi:transketolase